MDKNTEKKEKFPVFLLIALVAVFIEVTLIEKGKLQLFGMEAGSKLTPANHLFYLSQIYFGCVIDYFVTKHKEIASLTVKVFLPSFLILSMVGTLVWIFLPIGFGLFVGGITGVGGKSYATGILSSFVFGIILFITVGLIGFGIYQAIYEKVIKYLNSKSISLNKREEKALMTGGIGGGFGIILLVWFLIL